MLKLARVGLILAVLLSFAAPVQALFASGSSCCKTHACCRRSQGAGWKAAASCGSACGCAMAGPATVLAVTPAREAVAGLQTGHAVTLATHRGAYTRPVDVLSQRPPPIA